jgi:hypothetical protein
MKRLRALVGAVFAFCFSATNAPVHGEGADINAVARTVSLYWEIQNVCPQFYAIDPIEVRKWGRCF